MKLFVINESDIRSLQQDLGLSDRAIISLKTRELIPPAENRSLALAAGTGSRGLYWVGHVDGYDMPQAIHSDAITHSVHAPGSADACGGLAIGITSRLLNSKSVVGS